MSDPHKEQDRHHRVDETAHIQPSGSSSRADQTSLDMPSGSGLGKYRILERVGKTYYAIVYKARDSLLDRLVTVKQMNPAFIDDPMACGDFRREAQFLARIPKDARYVVNIHELIEDRRGLFIVEEYVPGQTLELLLSKQQVDTTDSIRLLKSACLGLRTLHALKIVHRDMRPANLIVGKQGQVRITNLGCSAHEGDITAPRTVSARYAAPELQSGDEHDSRVDIYSLGLIIYELCVGRRKFTEQLGAIPPESNNAGDHWTRWHADRTTSLPDAMELNTLVAPALSEILRRMTAKDLNERFASVEEILAQLAANFSIEKASLQKKTASGGNPRFLEIWPARGLSSLSYQTNHALTRPGGQGLGTWSITADQLTTTHSVQAVENDARTPRHVQTTSSPRSDVYRPTGPRSRVIAHRPRRSLPCIPPPAVKSCIADHEIEAKLIHGRRRRRWITTGVVALAAVVVMTVMSASWQNVFQSPQQISPAEKIVAEGMIAYDTEDYDAARQHFERTLELNVAGPEIRSLRKAASRMLLIIEGQFALRRDDFDVVQKIIEKAQSDGVEPHILGEFQRKYWNKKDAYRVAAESVHDLSTGHFDKAEARAEEYKEKALDAGLDPMSLHEHVERNREEARYEESIAKTRMMLEEGDYEAANIILRDAEAIHRSADTRELRQKILDGKKRDDLLVRGDKAMQDGDFAAAQEAYEAAIEIHASEEVEKKLRTAGAELSFEAARLAIEKGNLLEGKRLLENSLWKNPNPKARLMLLSKAAEFEAAHLVRKGDQAAAARNYSEAARLYKKALKNLPDTVKGSVEKKLEDVKNAKPEIVPQEEKKMTPLDDSRFPR